MNGFIQTLRNLGPLRLGAIALVTFSLLGFFGFLTARISTAPMSILYTELDGQDAGAIVSKLESLKVPYEVAPNGGIIRVPGDQVGKIRMMMAAEGLPKGGSIGYEIFDQKEGFGTTSFVQNINHLRALEGELARTIATISSVQSARVHLVLPQRELFSHSTQTATASVFIKTRGTLSREQIASVQHLIAAAVPQLQPNEISIVDDKGSLLAKPTDNANGVGASTQEEMRVQYEKTQARKIEDLLAQTLGFGKVRAQVSADLDFDRITTSSEIYDPESQVVRSQQTTSEDSSSSDGNNNTVSITNNLPGGQAANGAAGSANSSNRAEETINYEINKTVRQQVKETGEVKRLSVAVVVDGTTTKDKEGNETYTARTKEELNKITDLVKTAVNFDATRGDTVKVENMRFVEAELGTTGADAADMIMGIPKLDLLRIAETLMLAFIGLMVVLLVIRPILKRLFETATDLGMTGGQNMLAAGASGGYGTTAQLPAPSSSFGEQLQSEAEDSEIEKMIDISRVEGRVKASSLRKVGEIVDKHPEEAVSILRNWIYQENR
ncbi:MAG: flagellar M-ring protein FliF [Proteobacteria bacterium]|nr:flagellar basal-body MS-ring/collar protein FliF [Alphaproteobacteria bacterium]NCC03160.1 flagellar M-ring protein FliF [Pseudomonadota bacterium]